MKCITIFKLLLSCAFVILSGAIAQNKETERQEYMRSWNLQPNPTLLSYTEKEITLGLGMPLPSDEEFSIRTYTFDNLGNRLEYISFRGGEEKMHLVKKYDDRGNTIEASEYYTGELSYLYQYKFNDQNELIEKIYTTKDSVFKEEYIYNEDGKNLITLSFNSDSDFVEQLNHEYDIRGNLTRKFSIGEDGQEIKRFQAFYDEFNNKTETISNDLDGSFFKHYISKYDIQGNVIENVNYDSDGEILSIVKYKFDRNGTQVERAEYNQDNELISFSKKNKQGNLIEDFNQRYDRREIYEYDSQGNKVEYIKSDIEGKLKAQKIYGDDERLLEYIRYEDDGNVRTIKFEYNQFGDIIQESEYDLDDVLIALKKCDYVYDSYSNWIEQRCEPYWLLTGVNRTGIIYTTVRVIEYVE